MNVMIELNMLIWTYHSNCDAFSSTRDFEIKSADSLFLVSLCVGCLVRTFAFSGVSEPSWPSWHLDTEKRDKRMSVLTPSAG